MTAATLYSERETLKTINNLEELDLFIKTNTWKQFNELIDSIFIRYCKIKMNANDGQLDVVFGEIGTIEYWNVVKDASEEENI